MAHWSDRLKELGACAVVVEWARTQPSLEVAWQECRRGDWMLWLIARCPHDRRLLVRAAALCAETAIQYCTDDRTADVCTYAVQTCAAWSCREATGDDLRAAAAVVSRAKARAAAAALADVPWAAARAACAAAAEAIMVAKSPGWAAAGAVRAAEAASVRAMFGAPEGSPEGSPGGRAAALPAEVAARALCAEIVRGVFPAPPEVA